MISQICGRCIVYAMITVASGNSKCHKCPISLIQATPEQYNGLRELTLASCICPQGGSSLAIPFVQPDTEQFTVSVDPGDYDVEVEIAHLSGDQRIAAAYVQFAPGNVSRWEMALLAQQNTSDLKKNEFFCYGVDSGTGGFLSPEAGQVLIRLMDEEDNDLYSILGDEMELTYVDTRSWLNKVVDTTNGANLIAFSSGFGDGCYPSYFGYSSDGTRICLVTDFELFELDDQSSR